MAILRPRTLTADRDGSEPKPCEVTATTGQILNTSTEDIDQSLNRRELLTCRIDSPVHEAEIANNRLATSISSLHQPPPHNETSHSAEFLCDRQLYAAIEPVPIDQRCSGMKLLRHRTQ